MFVFYSVVAALVLCVQFIKGSKSGESFGRVLFYSLLVAVFWPIGVLITVAIALLAMFSSKTTS